MPSPPGLSGWIGGVRPGRQSRVLRRDRVGVRELERAVVAEPVRLDVELGVRDVDPPVVRAARVVVDGDQLLVVEDRLVDRGRDVVEVGRRDAQPGGPASRCGRRRPTCRRGPRRTAARGRSRAATGRTRRPCGCTRLPGRRRCRSPGFRRTAGVIRVLAQLLPAVRRPHHHDAAADVVVRCGDCDLRVRRRCRRPPSRSGAAADSCRRSSGRCSRDFRRASPAGPRCAGRRARPRLVMRPALRARRPRFRLSSARRASPTGVSLRQEWSGWVARRRRPWLWRSSRPAQ